MPREQQKSPHIDSEPPRKSIAEATSKAASLFGRRCAHEKGSARYNTRLLWSSCVSNSQACWPAMPDGLEPSPTTLNNGCGRENHGTTRVSALTRASGERVQYYVHRWGGRVGSPRLGTVHRGGLRCVRGHQLRCRLGCIGGSAAGPVMHSLTKKCAACARHSAHSSWYSHIS